MRAFVAKHSDTFELAVFAAIFAAAVVLSHFDLLHGARF